MQVFLTGGTGFVGKETILHLLAHGHQVTALVREGSERKLALASHLMERISFVHGDITDSPDQLAKTMENCDAVINLVGIIREYPRRGITFETLHYEGSVHVMEGAKLAGVRRFVQMSALGVGPQSTAPYHTTKRRAEEHLIHSGLVYTIFRPSGIFGREDAMFNYFAHLLRQAPFTPVIGDGEYAMQPVALETVAEAFARSIDNPVAEGKIYELGGPKKYSYNEILRIIGRTIGRPVRLIHVPVALMRPLIRMMEGFPFFPITQNQLTMLLQGNTTDDFAVYEDLGLPMVDFEKAIATYLG